MTALVDTSVLVDHLRGKPEATGLLSTEAANGRLHASEITRLELLAGLRAHEEEATSRLLQSLVWHPVDRSVAEEAGRLGRRWLPDHRGIDSADLAIAATARLLEARLLTLNVRHFPMFPGLGPPY
ncbi:MAG: type II toxin-antitoxin system VapC family toxin [Candidatus Dormibacteraceae bacterium]